MRPFSGRNYTTPVRHVARVVTRQHGEEEETWPGPGTLLYCNPSQGSPKGRFTHQVEESLTDWELWFGYQALVTASVVMRRGDRLVIAQDYGAEIILRTTAHAIDWNQLHVNWYVQAQQLD